jgi:hypothetical protein
MAHSQPSTPESGHPPLDAYRLRSLIAAVLREQPDIADARPTETIYQDRFALFVEDRHGQLWRVQVMREAL